MCIISGPVQSVNSTKLLALPSRNKQRQLTVYSNSVITPNSNAMCLPVPNPETVRFEKVPKDIFKQCSNSFKESLTRGGPILLSFNSRSNNRPQLQIQSHGSYDVVLVPSIDDIDRVPPHFTILTTDVIEFLKASYPSHFGIILCRLKKGATNYEPFAYSHALQANKQLFYPTKHFHIMTNNYSNNRPQEDEEPGWASGFGNTMLGVAFELPGRQMPKINSTRVADDWDHEIYSAFTPEWCHSSKNKEMINRNLIKWGEMPRDFQFDANIQLRCKEIVGEERNIDIEMPV